MTTVTKPLTGIRNSQKNIMRPLGPKGLVPRLDASEAMIRMFLRKYYPDIHVKNKSWIFSPGQAKEIEGIIKTGRKPVTPIKNGASSRS
jgi:hypothetical protein